MNSVSLIMIQIKLFEIGFVKNICVLRNIKKLWNEILVSLYYF